MQDETKPAVHFPTAFNEILDRVAAIDPVAYGSSRNYLDGAFVDDDIDLEQTNSVGISGLNNYYKQKKIARYPYVRVTEVPNF